MQPCKNEQHLPPVLCFFISVPPSSNAIELGICLIVATFGGAKTPPKIENQEEDGAVVKQPQIFSSQAKPSSLENEASCVLNAVGDLGYPIRCLENFISSRLT